MANDVAEPPAETGQGEALTTDYVDQTISSAIPESDRKYLDEQPEKAERP